jgi:hypothetical protein
VNEQQIDINKVIESLVRQVAEYARKVALLEAYIEQANSPADIAPEAPAAPKK